MKIIFILLVSVFSVASFAEEEGRLNRQEVCEKQIVQKVQSAILDDFGSWDVIKWNPSVKSIELKNTIQLISSTQYEYEVEATWQQVTRSRYFYTFTEKYKAIAVLDHNDEFCGKISVKSLGDD